MIHILVVEDDVNLNQIICTFLSSAGYFVTGCYNAAEAFDAMETTMFNLILTDIMMPGMDGFAFAEVIRDADKVIPIMFLTAREDMPAKQRGYRLGIDDYLVKPVEMDELVLRVGALLRRANITSSKRLSIGALSLDADEHSAYLADAEIPLTVREFDILFKLLSYPKKTFTRTQLMDEFWGFDTESSPRTVDVYITKLRDKFSACEDFEIVTIHGLGYKAVLK
ncbi:MAG TPA: response regulator transcription factor [Clostridia bacterium]|nr:response regulator transcription factor [Clostridia bacterium]